MTDSCSLTIRLLGTGSLGSLSGLASFRDPPLGSPGGLGNGTVFRRLITGSGWYRHVNPYAEPAMANRRQRGSTFNHSTLCLLTLLFFTIFLISEQ